MEITIRQDEFDVSATIDSPQAVEEFVRRVYLAQDSVWKGSLEEPVSEDEIEAQEQTPAPQQSPTLEMEPDAEARAAPTSATMAAIGAEADLSTTQQRVLAAVRKDGSAPVWEIANQLGIATQTARNILAVLRKRGLL